MSRSVDWVAVEASLRAGETLREVAAVQGVSHVTIGKRAKKEGWPTDVKRKKAKAKKVNKVTKPVVNKERLVNPAEEPAQKRGAPTTKTPTLIAAICEAIASGVSVRATCETLKISRSALHDWLLEDHEFADQYARAKDLGMDLLAEEVIEIADFSREDTYTTDDGTVKVDNEVVRRSQLRIEARKWYVGKIAPKKYGERMLRTDGDLDVPIASIQIVFVEPGENRERLVNPGKVVQIEGARRE
jgi:hypothetical protein